MDVMRGGLLLTGVLFIMIGGWGLLSQYQGNVKRSKQTNKSSSPVSSNPSNSPRPVIPLGDNQWVFTAPVGKWHDTGFPVTTQDVVTLNGGVCKFQIKIGKKVFSGQDNIPVSIALDCADGNYPPDFLDTIKIKVISGINGYDFGQIRLVRGNRSCAAWAWSPPPQSYWEAQERKKRLMEALSR
jgi:hypothetical protein